MLDFERTQIYKEKGLTIEECIKRADRYITNNDMCLFLFDVKESRKYNSREKLQKTLNEIIIELNKEFNEYFPENSLATFSKKEKGFCSLFGDSSWAGINNSEVIKKIVKYLTDNYPEISFHWGIAKDGWDEEGLKVIK